MINNCLSIAYFLGMLAVILVNPRARSSEGER